MGTYNNAKNVESKPKSHHMVASKFEKKPWKHVPFTKCDDALPNINVIKNTHTQKGKGRNNKRGPTSN